MIVVHHLPSQLPSDSSAPDRTRNAEDLVQEVFLQGWHQAQSYSPERGSPEAWLITMRRSRGIHKLRSIRRRNMRTLAPDQPGRHGNGAQMEPPTDTNEP